MNNEMQEVNNFFKSHHVPLSNLWLESCINWFQEQQSGRNYTMNELCTMVYEQWLLLDLRDVEIPQLTPYELEEIKVVINRTLSLQLMSVVDISKPKFSQLQKMRNLLTITDNVEETDDGNYNNNNRNVNGKRVLQLRLTDGIHEIMGLEYKPVPALSLDLTPGMKIRINPPVTVRRGQLMLEQHNVKLLGGEVEEIIVPNSAENILLRALSLPERSDPAQAEEPSVVNTADNMHREADNPLQNTNVSNVNINTVNGRNKNTVHNNTAAGGFSEEEEEELRIAAEIDMLMEVERDFEPSRTSTCISPHMFEDQIESRTSTEPEPEVEEDIFTNINIDQHLDQIEEQMGRISQEKEIRIIDLGEKWKSKAVGKHRVHARFKSIVQKLTFTESWILQILIADDSGEINVFVHSDVISELIGYSLSTMMELKKGAQAKNPEAIKTIMKALDGLRDKLLKLNCLMEIEIASSSNYEAPLITALL